MDFDLIMAPVHFVYTLHGRRLNGLFDKETSQQEKLRGRERRQVESNSFECQYLLDYVDKDVVTRKKIMLTVKLTGAYLDRNASLLDCAMKGIVSVNWPPTTSISVKCKCF